MKKMKALAALSLLALGACKPVVLSPSGDVAARQRDLLIQSTLLMLVIIIPVMLLIIFFAWKYRESRKQETYRPDWDHSTKLELVIWAAPLLIIVSLGALTWVGTHLLDPYRPLDRIAADQPAGDVTPLEIEVVALDWKWLFIYPEEGVAAVNELALPLDRPVRFNLTSSTVMNAFYIPAMAGMIYAMPGMETKLHGVFDKTGTFDGFSANYSGWGFSNMRFAVKSLPAGEFDKWVAEAKASSEGDLSRDAYLKLEKPTHKEPVRRFAASDPQLFDAVVNMCVEPGKMCMHDMMAIDARGGLGLAGVHNVRELAYDKFAARGSLAALPALPSPTRYVAEVCTTPMIAAARPDPKPVDARPLTGQGLSRPGDKPRDSTLALFDNRGPVSRPAS